MKYERRTDPRFVPASILVCSSKCVALEIYNRLAELEDKIESGEIDYVADKDKEIARLTAENAELKARLEKAVELPCEVGDVVYCIKDLTGLGIYRIEEQTVIEIVFDYNNQMHIKTLYGMFGYEKWTFNIDCFTDRSAAEARLAELKGGRQ